MAAIQLTKLRYSMKTCFVIKSSKQIDLFRGLRTFAAPNISDKTYTKKFEVLVGDKFLEQNDYLKPLVDEVRKFGITKDQILRVYMTKPELLQYDMTTALSSITALIEYGFDNILVLSMIKEYPELLSYSANDIKDKLEAWKRLHYGEQFLSYVLSSYPKLFSLPNEIVTDRIPKLRYYLGHKIGRVTRLLMNSPDVLFQDWKQVMYKLNYLFIKMKAPEGQVATSCALSHSLYHIKLRHTFLDKAGVYVPPSSKDKGFEPHVNPLLKNITDTKDIVFAVNVAQVSLDEFEVYKDLMQNYIKYEEEDFIRESPKLPNNPNLRPVDENEVINLVDSDDDDDDYSDDDDDDY